MILQTFLKCLPACCSRKQRETSREASQGRCHIKSRILGTDETCSRNGAELHLRPLEDINWEPVTWCQDTFSDRLCGLRLLRLGCVGGQPSLQKLKVLKYETKSLILFPPRFWTKLCVISFDLFNDLA